MVAVVKHCKHPHYVLACKQKFRLRELTSCLCSAAASAVCFEGLVAGLDATETGNELSQQFEFTGLVMDKPLNLNLG